METFYSAIITCVQSIILNYSQGLTTAFVYNAGMYSINMTADIKIVYPLLIASPQIVFYSATLLYMGVS